MAGEPEAGAEPAEIDSDAIDNLPPEEFDKLKRGEIEPPRKGAKPPDTGTKDEFDVDPKSETVPHGQFHRVNERRKAAEAETAKERTAREGIERQNAVLSQRVTELLEASKPAPRQEAQQTEPEDPGVEPDAAEGPYEWIVWKQKQERFSKFQQGQQTAQQKAVGETLEAQNAHFEAEQTRFPILKQAHEAWQSSVTREMQAGGHSPRAIADQINRTEIQYALWAHKNNRNIGEVMWNLALARGFQPPADGGQQHADAVDPTIVNGATPPRDANGKFTAAAAAMDKREQTKQAAKSLGGSGGPADTGELTPQMIADMPEAEWKAFKKKYGDDAMRKAFGVTQ